MMAMTKDQLLQEATKLPPQEQEQLADACWRLAHGTTPAQIEAEWATEIRRRLDAIERGEGSSKLSDDVVQRLRNKKAG
jgi:putative addiction module component (TIGR02574 family)